MYGKVFDSIYDGTLYGHWEAIVTMQQLIVLATPEGVVDMTPQAMAARTSIPIHIIEKGLAFLAEPDPYTRTPGDDGKRIVLLDDHRPWGWRLVNHAKYMRLRDMDQKREADRRRIAEKRKENSDVAITSRESPIQTQTHTQTQTKEEPLAPSSFALAAPGQVNGHDHADPVIEHIPLCDGTEFPVLKSFVSELDRLYPAVDPAQTLREIRGWCIGNPRRRKTKRGVKGFITSWFAREQDKQSRWAN